MKSFFTELASTAAAAFAVFIGAVIAAPFVKMPDYAEQDTDAAF